MSASEFEHDRITSRPDPLQRVLWGVACGLVVVAGVLHIRSVGSAGLATLGPFVTLAGVIVVAVGVDRIGGFRWIARRLVPEHAGPRRAFVMVLVLVALVSGLVNLDVAVVVAMPVALQVARRSGVPAGSLAIAVAITANAASILLPSSNLTNLLVMSRTPLGPAAYLRASWIAWLAVVAVTVLGLTGLLARGGEPPATRKLDQRGISPRALWDLVPMFLAATAIRTLLAGGIEIPGRFFEQAGVGSLLAAGVNNLPAAAAVHAASASGAWAGVLSMAIGPNLFLTGSVATVICRRLAREGGVELDPVRFSLVGLALTPLQLTVAFAGLHLAGAL
jgi:Na+/H+ antiporter NhaD/arsenite permease-like protein